MRDKSELDISRIYRWNVENTGLFFFIKAQLQLFPTLTIQQSMKNFRRLTGITYDEWDDESMRSTYTRLQKQYYEATKTDCGGTKPKGSIAE